jgi:WD40 repeat protein/GTPase SAR1 family protein
LSVTNEALTLEDLPRAGETYEPRERALAFARRYGEAHAALALYAALPLGLTPDLVHLLRVNFVPTAPWIAEADLLLSPLCREAGGEFYEMDARVRELLLDEFAADENFGTARLRRAAEFLYVYAGRARMAARRRDARAFWQAQEWTALAYARPEEAARVLASELGRKIDNGDASEALRVARVAHTLAAPLGAHDELVLYAAGFERMMSGGDEEEVFELFDAVGSNDGALSVAGISLPSTPELAQRLGLQTPRAATPAPEAPPQTRAAQNPPGLTLFNSFEPGQDRVTRLAWSPDGRYLAAPCADTNIYSWDSKISGTSVMQVHEGVVREVAWSPDGKQLAAITDSEILFWEDARQRGYEADKRQPFGKSLRSIAWSPDGDVLIVADASGVLMLPATSGRSQLVFREEGVNFVTWLPTGRMFAFASEGGDVGLCTAGRGAHIDARLKGHEAGVLSLAVSPEGRLLASGARDGVIKIWDVSTRLLAFTLEGHTGAVTSLSFSSDGRLLASKSTDGTVRLWNTQTREVVAVLDEPVTNTSDESGIAFHPRDPGTLATLDATGRGVRVWRLNLDLLMGREQKEGEVYYKNANVLLLGDVASGKTALAVRLIEYRTRPEERMHYMPPPTQGLSVRRLYEERVPAPDGGMEVREVTLCDPAGELMTRLSDNVRLADASLVLFVFDPSQQSGLYRDITRWNGELHRAQTAQGVSGRVKRFIVDARADFESESSAINYREFTRRKLSFDGYYRTSALTGEGVGELMSAILGAIDWDALPGVVTTKLFESVKNFVDEVRHSHVKMVTVEELLRVFRTSKSAPPDFERAEFEAALKGLESLGLLRLLDFGGLVLLRPEALDAATNELILQADDTGELPEER